MMPTMLVVEDNPFESRYYKRAFEKIIKLNYLTAHSLKEVNTLRVAKVDIILTDLNLEDSSGLNTLRKIKEYFPETPCIVLSILDKDHEVIDAGRLGADAFIMKDKCSLEQLRSTLLCLVGRAQLNYER